MPVQSNILPTTQIPAFVVPGNQGVNNNHLSRVSQTNQPWTLRLLQLSTTTSLPSDTFAQVGFDTITYNTYKAVGGNLYSLKFGALTSLPYSTITLPQFGYYDVDFRWSVNTSLMGAVFENDTEINYNGSALFYTSSMGTGGTGNEVNFGQIRDIFQFNPGDFLQFYARNLSTASPAGVTTFIAGGAYLAPRLIIRYLGLS